MLSAAPANAQATRTWVSGVGDDANPCSRTAPCKTFAGAISKTAAGGEINCIDPGGFGAVTIGKSLTILCDNTEAGVLVSGTNAIIVNLPLATDTVTLKGLDIEGLGTGINGITFIQQGTLHVQNVRIHGFRNGGNGINFAPSTAGATSELFVQDTTVSDSGNSGTTAGIAIRPTSSANAKVTLNRVQVVNNSSGIIASAGGTGTVLGIVRDSNVSGNANNGITSSSTGANINLMIDNVAVVGNGIALASSGTGAGMLVGRSSITANTTAVSAAAPSAIISYGDNLVNGNTNGESFSAGTPLAKK
jgi:hypothetical protein